MKLKNYLSKYKIEITSSTAVEYRLIDDPNYEAYKNTDFWPGFTAEQASIEAGNLVLDDVKIPLDTEGKDNNGFVTTVDGEKVALLFLE